MTGLDKILKEIKDEAAREAADVNAKAKAKAEAMLAEARAEADAKAARILAAAQQDVKDIEQGRASAIALQRRQRILAKKQQLLAETLGLAQEKLRALPEKEYFELLAKLAAGAAEAGEGVLFLNEADQKRAPKDFAQALSAALPKGASLSIAAESRPIDGGFVLKYGDVEQNCSFSAIFNARADEFSDLVRDVLFA